MRPRRHSMDSETSSDSWSVIQKNVEQPDHSSDDIEFEPSDSEDWHSDGEQQTNGHETNDFEGNDSIEEYDESQDDDGGDCEIVNEEEVLEVSGCRYYIPTEKICKSLDSLDAECCHSNVELLLRLVFPSTREGTRVAMLLFFALSTALFFLNNPTHYAEMDVNRSAEVFALGLQSREDFGRAFSPETMSCCGRFNFSYTCNRWQISTWSQTPSWHTVGPAAFAPLSASTNDTPANEINESVFFTRPTITVSPISISRYGKARDVCRQDELRRGRRASTSSLAASISDEIVVNVDPWIAQSTTTYLLAAPISISRMAQPQRDVCSQHVRREKAAPFPRTGRRRHAQQQKEAIKLLAARHQPKIAYKKPSPATQKDRFVLPRFGFKRSSFAKKRAPTGRLCFNFYPPCVEKNTTMKRYKGSKAIVAHSTTRQLSIYKRRPPIPSLPRLRRPCMDHIDSVKCWKSFGKRLEAKPKPCFEGLKTHFDWFTRRGRIRAENRRH